MEGFFSQNAPIRGIVSHINSGDFSYVLGVSIMASVPHLSASHSDLPCGSIEDSGRTESTSRKARENTAQQRHFPCPKTRQYIYLKRNDTIILETTVRQSFATGSHSSSLKLRVKAEYQSVNAVAVWDGCTLLGRATIAASPSRLYSEPEFN